MMSAAGGRLDDGRTPLEREAAFVQASRGTMARLVTENRSAVVALRSLLQPSSTEAPLGETVAHMSSDVEQIEELAALGRESGLLCEERRDGNKVAALLFALPDRSRSLVVDVDR